MTDSVIIYNMEQALIQRETREELLIDALQMIVEKWSLQGAGIILTQNDERTVYYTGKKGQKIRALLMEAHRIDKELIYSEQIMELFSNQKLHTIEAIYDNVRLDAFFLFAQTTKPSVIQTKIDRIKQHLTIFPEIITKETIYLS